MCARPGRRVLPICASITADVTACNTHAQDIIVKCWHQDPAQRPSSEKLLDLLREAAKS